MRFLVLLTGLVALISCAERQNSVSGLVTGGRPMAGALDRIDLTAPGVVTVLDSSTGNPIPNATVLIGSAVGVPFGNNLLTANAAGQVTLPAAFTAPEPVTVQATGYAALTFNAMLPEAATLSLDPLAAPSEIEIAGNTTTFPGIVNNDGNVHFALVLPNLSQKSMLNFNLSSVLSPQSDSITVVSNTFDIPSNITLPQQSQTYGFIPVNLNKPAYRSYVPMPGTYEMTAIHGTFPLSTVVNSIRNGGSIFGDINYFQFVGAGSVSVNAQADVTDEDIAVNQIAMDSNISVTAPQFTSANNVLAVALAENTGGLFSPTDLKNLSSGQTMKMAASSAMPNRFVLTLLMTSSSASERARPHELINPAPQDAFPFNLQAAASTMDFNQVSFSLLPAGTGAPSLLSLIGSPTASANAVQMTAPTLPTGLVAIGTYLTYSDVQTITDGSVSTQITSTLWELWQDGWTNSVTLPQITMPNVSGHTYQWQVLFLAGSSQANNAPNTIDLQDVTYVTRNVVNAQ